MSEWRDITDPEELFRLKREGYEIELKYHVWGWEPWEGTEWQGDRPYRARPRKPATKKVKMLCFYNGTTLFWHESGNGCAYRCRVPSEDKEIEVQDD